MRGAARDVPSTSAARLSSRRQSTLPIILMICVGIFEFGRAYQTWQVLTNAAREGARVAAIGGTTDLEVETAVRTYMAAERLGQRRHRADRGQPEGRPRLEHRHRGHDSVSVFFHLARPGSAVRKAGIHHWRSADDVSGRHHAERKLGDAHAQPNLRRSRHRRARRRRTGLRHLQHDEQPAACRSRRPRRSRSSWPTPTCRSAPS